MSRKRKIETEEQIRIIREYVKGHISRQEAARRAGVVPDTIVGWTRTYRGEGIAGFVTEKNEVYSSELKQQAVKAYLAGEGSQDKVCERYGIRGRKLLRHWIKAYNAHGDFNSVKHSGGGSYMKQGRETTQEERIQIAKDCID